MVISKAGTCGAVLDGKIYIAGGYPGTDYVPPALPRIRTLNHPFYRGLPLPGNETLSSVHRFDPFANTWEEVASLSQLGGRRFGCAAALGGKLYVAGGLQDPLSVTGQDTQILASVEYYEVSMNAWAAAAR